MPKPKKEYGLNKQAPISKKQLLCISDEMKCLCIDDYNKPCYPIFSPQVQ